MTGREVVEADNGLPERQQLREEVGPDETGYPCNEPDSRRARQVFSKISIPRRDQEITWTEGTRLADSGRSCAGARLLDHKLPQRAAILEDATKHLPFPSRDIVRGELSCDMTGA